MYLSAAIYENYAEKCIIWWFYSSSRFGAVPECRPLGNPRGAIGQCPHLPGPDGRTGGMAGNAKKAAESHTETHWGTQMTITRNIKIGNLIFLSIQPIPHPSCELKQFWKKLIGKKNTAWTAARHAAPHWGTIQCVKICRLYSASSLLCITQVILISQLSLIL